MTSYAHSTTSEWSSDRNKQVQFRNTQTQHYLQTVSQIIYFSTEINLPSLLFPSSWPYLKLILPCWFEFLDYHVKTLQSKMNNSLAAKLHQVERGLSTKHATKWRSLLLDSLLFTNVYIDAWKLKSLLIIPEINLLLNWEKQCNCQSFSLWISWPIFLSHVLKD